jgi:hypothetical protein
MQDDFDEHGKNVSTNVSKKNRFNIKTRQRFFDTVIFVLALFYCFIIAILFSMGAGLVNFDKFIGFAPH